MCPKFRRRGLVVKVSVGNICVVIIILKNI